MALLLTLLSRLASLNDVNTIRLRDRLSLFTERSNDAVETSSGGSTHHSHMFSREHLALTPGTATHKRMYSTY